MNCAINGEIAAVVLAAGKGTRMHSSKPKVLHALLGEPMLAHVLAGLRPIFGQNVIIVAGHKADLVQAAFPDERFVLQAEQLGTGHALMAALPEIEKSGAEFAAVINGDTPLLDSETMRKFLDRARGADIAFASIVLDNAGAYGRVSRKNGNVAAIVEARDFDVSIHGPETGEVNAGIYLLKTGILKELLPLLKNDNKSGEYYLTDLVRLGVGKNMDVRAISCGRDESLLGVNSPLELARMEESMRAGVIRQLLEKGVIIHAPQLVRASPAATIEPGAEITGPCEIYGKSIIRSGAVIESHCLIRDSEVCENATVLSFSHMDKAIAGKDARVGPYARLRPGAELAKEAHVGNFVELKKTRLGEGSKANHLSYLGDSDIDSHVNIGAGTITCNYDGKNKFQTRIGANAFIGSNTSLVAPVSIGADALVGAGSVITADVPDGKLGIARERQKNLPRRKILK